MTRARIAVERSGLFGILLNVPDVGLVLSMQFRQATTSRHMLQGAGHVAMSANTYINHLAERASSGAANM